MNRTVTVDVREDIRQGREPFSKIMNAAAALQNGDQLLVLAPFEPVPLFGVLAKQGFRHSSTPLVAGDWEVRFTRQSDAASRDTASAGASCGSCRDSAFMPGNAVELDARGLEPPQPMVRILEALAGLPEGAQLNARTDRRPIHLYPQLEERGFTAETQAQPDGSFLTHVRRR
ncbi:MAG TPA: DUF2249 domain-containing protein [Candidatus Binatia bacterium]|jgi:uncharacterized protein (DUF2249 family)|nr:DUF2249 domain-containing protein [Candidatus Binatia bacterium]